MMTTKEIIKLYIGDWLLCSNTEHRWHTYAQMRIGPRIVLWLGVINYPDITPQRLIEAPFRVFIEVGGNDTDRHLSIKTLEETIEKAGDLIAKQILVGQVVNVEKLPDWLRKTIAQQLGPRLSEATNVFKTLNTNETLHANSQIRQQSI